MKDPDLHVQNAARMFGVPEDQVTPHQRHLSKMWTFGQRFGSARALEEVTQSLQELEKIVVLYRQPDTMSLYGIPYRMRDDIGQQPRDLDRAGNREGWIWLGTPGWWGSMPRVKQVAVQGYLDALRGLVPTHPGEWSYVGEKIDPS